MDSLGSEDLVRADKESELTSIGSGVSSIYRGEDSPSSASSTEFPCSSNNGSSGEILVSVVEIVVMLPKLLSSTHSTGDVASEVVRQRCVGNNNKGVTWGFTSIIGRWPGMEDAVAIIPSFVSSSCDHVGDCTAPGSQNPGDNISPVHFFGVYDGHGSSQVAKFCAERVHEVVAEEWGRVVSGGCWRRRWEVAFSTGFERADNESVTIASKMVGSTTVVVAVSGCQIITSNCGDSRALLCRGTQTIPLTVDHKPDREDELVRIEGGRGRVINWNGARVYGVLAMSRTIGDRYMRPWIIPVPEVTFTTRSEEDDCLIVASDGLWDVMTNDEVGELARQLFIRQRRTTMADGNSSPPAQFVADHLTNVAYKRNSSDNISVIVVDLKPRRRRPHRQ